MKMKKIIVTLLLTFALVFANLSGIVSVPTINKTVSAKTKINLKITNVTGLSGKHQTFKIKVKNNGKKTVTVKTYSVYDITWYNGLNGDIMSSSKIL